MPVIAEYSTVKPVTTKPCPKCGRLMSFEFNQGRLNSTRGILYCDCCKYSRNLFEVVNSEQIQEVDGHYILNKENFQEVNSSEQKNGL